MKNATNKTKTLSSREDNDAQLKTERRQERKTGRVLHMNIVVIFSNKISVLSTIFTATLSTTQLQECGSTMTFKRKMKIN